MPTPSNSINESTAGICSFTGTGFTSTPVTSHAILVGGATSGSITNLSLGTANQAIRSGGAAADPAFSTATYPATTTAGQLLYSSATNAISGLTSANNGSLITDASGNPSVTTIGNSKVLATNSTGVVAGRSLSVNIQKFTAAGTYTPTTGMLYCVIEVVGNGGGGGGTASTSAGQFAVAGGGGAGEYARGVFTAATIGASQSITFGATGTGATAGANSGTAGGTVAVGAIISAAGGGGGSGGSATSSGSTVGGGTGGTGGTGGSFRGQGMVGFLGLCSTGLSILSSGYGGSSFFGQGGPGQGGGAAGGNGYGYGSGGGGGASGSGDVAHAGGNGATGIVVITEYIVN